MQRHRHTPRPFGPLAAAIVLTSAAFSNIVPVSFGQTPPLPAASRLGTNPGAAPVILAQPESSDVPIGNTRLLQVVASGEPAPSFQWMLNGDFIPGATESTLLLPEMQPADSGDFSVLVYNSFGSVESRPAKITVAAQPLPFADLHQDGGALFGPSGSGKGNNYLARREEKDPFHPGQTGGKSVWVQWTAPSSGIATLSTVGSTFDTLLAVYDAEPAPALPPIATDDDSGGYQTSLVRFNARENQTYHIAVEGLENASGDIILNWNLAPAENFLPTILRAPQHLTLNRRENLILEIQITQASRYSIQWFKDGNPIPGAHAAILNPGPMRDDLVGRYHVEVSDQGLPVYSSPPAEIQINTEGLPIGARNKRALANDSGFKPGKTSAPSPGKPIGKLSLPAPSFSSSGNARGRNLRLLDGGLVRGYSGTQLFSTSPGKDPGEPNHCGVVGGASYWFSYQAPRAGVLSMNTDGSSFDTVLAVYRDDGLGNGYGSLISVACDNNGGFDGRDSSLSFNAAADVTYYVVVDGVGGATGTVYLNYNLNSAPTISDIANRTIPEDSNTGAISLTVGDAETYASSLYVMATSSNPALVPTSGLSLGGTGASRTLRVTPAANRFGSATITVTVLDGAGASAADTFTLTVTAVNDPPVVTADYGTRFPNQMIAFHIPKLLGNDADIDGDRLSLSGLSSRSASGAGIFLSGEYVLYIPPASFNSSDYFHYSISDGKGGTASGAVHVNVSSASGTSIVR